MAPTSIPSVVPPPPGVTPNPHNPHARFKTANVIIAAVGISLCTVSLAMRIYTKAHLLHRFWLDDVFIILAWVFSIATQSTILWAFYHAGYGLHIWDFTVPTLTTYLKTVTASSILYIPALAFAKLALLLLYHSIIAPTSLKKSPAYLLYAFGAIIVSYSLALILALIFACDPLDRAWDASVTRGSCISRNAVFLATAITNTASDVVLLGVAVWIVRGLRVTMGFWARVGLVFLLGVGGVTTAMSIVRVVTLMPQVTAMDKPYALAEASIFILIEANLIILCASLPYLRHFLRHHRPRFLKEPCVILSFMRRTKRENVANAALPENPGAETRSIDVLPIPSISSLGTGVVDRS